MQNYVTIKEPCHENWDQMSVSEKGRFCASCKKHVHDFTHSSLTDIKTSYQENNGSLCGRMSAKQLREQYVQAQIQKNHSGYLRKFFFATLFCFGASLFTLDSAKASTLQNLKHSFLNFISTPEGDTITIYGSVEDKETHEKIIFATVSIFYKDSLISQTNTNIDGKFQFEISNDNFKKINFKINYIGYMSIEIKDVEINKKNIYLNFLLKPDKNAVYMIGLIDASDNPPLNNPTGPSGKTFNAEEFRNMPK